MSSDIFMIVDWVLAQDSKQNGPSWHCRSQAFYGFLACDIYNSEIVVYCSQTMHKIPYSKKLWRGKNYGEFGESQQFANFFLPISHFCNMRREHKREVRFNLFCIKIYYIILYYYQFYRLGTKRITQKAQGL